MKKIGIFTLVDYNNYGNRFQNYATHYILSSMGYDVETIVYKVVEKNKLSKVKKLTPHQIVRTVMKKVQNNFDSGIKDRALLQKKKEQNFRDFTLKYLKEFHITITSEQDLDNLNTMYDYFIVGSDQVWNPYFFNGITITNLNFLTFASKEKRIALAASFGIDNIPRKNADDYKNWLSGIEHLSVRENSGAKIIRELTDKDATVLIDPTLMITKEQWLNISKPIRHYPSKKFILSYLIGEEAAQYRELVKKYTDDMNIELVNLGDFTDADRYTIDPGEFVSYINEAQAIITNSFHGAIFSILFEKPFMVYNRVGESASMNTRIDTLLQKFNLKNRVLTDIQDFEDIFNIDFTQIKPQLEKERKKFREFLEIILNSKAE